MSLRYFIIKQIQYTWHEWSTLVHNSSQSFPSLSISRFALFVLYLLGFPILSKVFSMSYITSYEAETTSGTVTSWLPIITSFSAGTVYPGCSWPAVAQSSTSSKWMAYYAWGTQLEECMPTEVYKWWQPTAKPAEGLYTVFSMGPVLCPSG